MFDGVFPNVALDHATDMMKTEAARLDGQLVEDFNVVLKGNCTYANDFACDRRDFYLFEKIKAEIEAHEAEDALKRESKGGTESGGMVDWSRHMKYENPVGVSVVFQQVVEMLCEYFDTEMFACRLNYYGNGNHWKPFHHDSHAYGAKGQREDITIGLSLGATRGLAFLHEPSKKTFNFPQLNGDVFAFTSEVNNRFMHGVPKGPIDCGERFSIIVWGHRRTINARNGGGIVCAAIPKSIKLETMEDAVAAAHAMVTIQRPVAPVATEGGSNAAAAKKKKNRLQ